MQGWGAVLEDPRGLSGVGRRKAAQGNRPGADDVRRGRHRPEHTHAEEPGHGGRGHGGPQLDSAGETSTDVISS